MKHFLLLLLLCCSCSPELTPEETVISQVKIFTSAFFSDNYTEAVKYTHSRLLNMSGGEEGHIKMLKDNKEMMLNDGVIIENFEVSEDVSIAKFSDNEYHCLVPTTMIMIINGQKMEVRDYFFGFSDAAQKEWKFVQTELLRDNAGTLSPFQNFKTNIEIPDKPDPVPID